MLLLLLVMNGTLHDETQRLQMNDSRRQSEPKCDDVWVPFDPPPVDPADILSGIHQYITSNKNNDIPLFMSDKTLQPLQYEETNTVANIAGTYVLISMCIILGHLLNPLIGCLMLLLLMMVVV